MKAFHSPRMPLTPEVALDPERRTLHITGECYPEDPTLFFGPLLAALRSDSEPPPDHFDASLRLSYVNSASAIWLRRIFIELDALASTGVPVNVAWGYDEDDDIALELGQDLSHQLHAISFLEQPFAG
jgi:hypothetical protein